MFLLKFNYSNRDRLERGLLLKYSPVGFIVDFSTRFTMACNDQNRKKETFAFLGFLLDDLNSKPKSRVSARRTNRTYAPRTRQLMKHWRKPRSTVSDSSQCRMQTVTEGTLENEVEELLSRLLLEIIQLHGACTSHKIVASRRYRAFFLFPRASSSPTSSLNTCHFHAGCTILSLWRIVSRFLFFSLSLAHAGNIATHHSLRMKFGIFNADLHSVFSFSVLQVCPVKGTKFITIAAQNRT